MVLVGVNSFSGKPVVDAVLGQDDNNFLLLVRDDDSDFLAVHIVDVSFEANLFGHVSCMGVVSVYLLWLCEILLATLPRYGVDGLSVCVDDLSIFVDAFSIFVDSL